MSDDYAAMVKSSSLRFKGEKKKKKHKKKHKKGKRSHEESSSKGKLHKRHRVYWPVSDFVDLTGNVLVESESGRYLIALDDGSVTVSETTKDSDEPDVQEIFTFIRISEHRVALKTAFNRFVSCEDDGRVEGRQEAIGVKEMWEPIFDDGGKLSLRGHNKKILKVAVGERACCDAALTDADVNFNVFSSVDKTEKKEEEKEKANEERNAYAFASNLSQVEHSFTKRYQSWQDGKLRMSKEDKKELKRAKQTGQLHGSLLNRRVKMKSDRYCM
eukprot:m.43678 g.43678  ORF g.43678 m.43678 type:complete len:272 (+) comp10566_c1_seq1:51-866(+)